MFHDVQLYQNNLLLSSEVFIGSHLEDKVQFLNELFPET